MSTALTMQDLELEHAELLPARETLAQWRQLHPGGVRQHGPGRLLNVAALNGSANNILSLGSGNIW